MHGIKAWEKMPGAAAGAAAGAGEAAALALAPCVRWCEIEAIVFSAASKAITACVADPAVFVTTRRRCQCCLT